MLLPQGEEIKSASVTRRSRTGFDDIEHDIDTLRAIQAPTGIFYEHVSLPCVEEAFQNDSANTPISVIREVHEAFPLAAVTCEL